MAGLYFRGVSDAYPYSIQVHIRGRLCCRTRTVRGRSGFGPGGGSIGGLGSSAVPVFDSRSEASLTSEGEGKYAVSYTNRSDHDLACFGFVLPEELAHDYYEALEDVDWEEVLASGEGGPEDLELQEAFDAAATAGHVAIITGTDGFSYVDYFRALIKEQQPDLTDEEVEEVLDQTMAAIDFDGLFGEDTTLVNFVDEGATATWAAQMATALPGSDEAGGIVTCFNGFGREGMTGETTYVEIEHAEEGTGSLSNVLGSLDIGGSLGS